MLCHLQKLSIKQGLKLIFCHFEKIYRKNNNCRVAMTTYLCTSCNSKNIVACLVSGEGLVHACISCLIFTSSLVLNYCQSKVSDEQTGKNVLGSARV